MVKIEEVYYKIIFIYSINDLRLSCIDSISTYFHKIYISILFFLYSTPLYCALIKFFMKKFYWLQLKI